MKAWSNLQASKEQKHAVAPPIRQLLLYPAQLGQLLKGQVLRLGQQLLQQDEAAVAKSSVESGRYLYTAVRYSTALYGTVGKILYCTVRYWTGLFCKAAPLGRRLRIQLCV